MTSIEPKISVLSNSTLSDFVFDKAFDQIGFNASGEIGTAGNCNFSLLQALLLRHPLLVRIDEELQTYVYYQNETYISLNFKYTHASILQVIINGTEVIPEFPPEIILHLFLLATLLAIIFSKRMSS